MTASLWCGPLRAIVGSIGAAIAVAIVAIIGLAFVGMIGYHMWDEIVAEKRRKRILHDGLAKFLGVAEDESDRPNGE